MSILLGKAQEGAQTYTDAEGNLWQRTSVARKECSRMSWDDVRSLCIEKQFYTKGDSDEYSNLAELIYSWEDAEKDITVDMLQVVAEDILQHSNTEYNIDAIMYELSSKCVRRFYTVAEH